MECEHWLQQQSVQDRICIRCSRIQGFAVKDVALLSALFFHRLWRDTSSNRLSIKMPNKPSYDGSSDEQKNFETISKEQQQLIYPKFRYIRNLYPLMFFLDLLCMLIVVFGYSLFGEGGTGDVVSDIQGSNNTCLQTKLSRVFRKSLLKAARTTGD
uniref:Uncharacterized protein n=1 Tax=Globodera rostochiensis TaxID=31243 RepID=A0A914HU91_GLORO